MLFLALANVKTTKTDFNEITYFIEKLTRIAKTQIVLEFSNFFSKILSLENMQFVRSFLNQISKIVSYFLNRLNQENHHLARGR